MRLTEEYFDTWDGLWNFYQQRFRSEGSASDSLWVFRGQKCAKWGLETALDRAHRRFQPENLPLVEEGLVREFQRVMRNTGAYKDLPRHDNILEWLALMRHYGAPTRLHDWTYSFVTALSFAVEAADEDEEFAVWALDVRWCNKRSRAQLPYSEDDVRDILKRDPYIRELGTFRFLFARQPPVPLVYRINPYILNERLAVQKGLFLCPGDGTLTFENNLGALQTEKSDDQKLIKIRISAGMYLEVLRQLHFMNVTMDRLFPGLDGLARSLNTRFAIKEALIPRWRERKWNEKKEHFGDWPKE